MCTANCDHTFLWEYSIIYHHLVLKYRTKKLYLCNRPVVWTIVVVKWSACRPSTPTIQCRIPLTPKVFAEKFVLEKNKNEQKETGAFLKKNMPLVPTLKSYFRLPNPLFFFKKGPILASFCLFSVFSSNFLQQSNVKKCQVHPVYGARIRTHDLWNLTRLP